MLVWDASPLTMLYLVLDGRGMGVDLGKHPNETCRGRAPREPSRLATQLYVTPA